MIRFAVLAAAAALAFGVGSGSGAQAGPTCATYGDATTLLSGTVYAMEAFDDASQTGSETTNAEIARERRTDFYALVMPERICLQGVDGDPQRPGASHVSIVRLDMPAEMAKMVVQRSVVVQGPLSNGGPDADPPVVMKVAGLAAQ
ncbi:hypothetical protein ACO2Q0_06120 [Phenylobacterium sp. VNQ135]|uniref:hypothetical protein n=1 Tax=Phenylobacterium sp. VNQ135 TaxID=3400922 RepID=UPI003C08B7FF